MWGADAEQVCLPETGAVQVPAGAAQVVRQLVRQVWGSFAGVISPARRGTWSACTRR